MQLPDPFSLVIFGATGDLAMRKLWPSLEGLWRRGFLPGDFLFLGVGRRPHDDNAMRAEVRAAVENVRADAPTQLDDFLGRVYYQSADLAAPPSLRALGERLDNLDRERQLPGNRLFYLATDPKQFCPAIENLAAAGLLDRDADGPWTRVVIEKPFGHDLASARALDRHIARFARPQQIFRIDHYLGKDTVQNLLAFRFGNSIFEPLFNRRYVDHVQITVAETVGMEGHRGAYYDDAGALRDVVQNHMLQLLALVAMDPPATLRARDIGDAKLKVLRNLRAPTGPGALGQIVRGQYTAGRTDGKEVPAYRDEAGVSKTSSTETFVALHAEVESWRWAGVPFFLRTGKRLARRFTEIAVRFQLPPLRLFRTLECAGDVCDLKDAQASVLVFRLQPDEGISLSFSAKRPGMLLDLHPVRFDFDYGRSFAGTLPEAYERLLFDALRGDGTLFMRSDELEAAWEYITPILDAWRQMPPSDLPKYAAGSWGPPEADALTTKWGGWRNS